MTADARSKKPSSKQSDPIKPPFSEVQTGNVQNAMRTEAFLEQNFTKSRGCVLQVEGETQAAKIERDQSQDQQICL